MSTYPEAAGTITGSAWADTCNYSPTTYKVTDRREDLGVVILRVGDTSVALTAETWGTIVADLTGLIGGQA